MAIDTMTTDKKEVVLRVGDAVVTINETDKGCVNIQVCCCKTPNPTPEPTVSPR